MFQRLEQEINLVKISRVNLFLQHFDCLFEQTVVNLGYDQIVAVFGFVEADPLKNLEAAVNFGHTLLDSFVVEVHSSELFVVWILDQITNKCRASLNASLGNTWCS